MIGCLRYLHKSYWLFGPFEVQYGHLSRELVVFLRRPWRLLFAVTLPGGVW